ncbi:hypothetical protein AVEN_158974-1 [Araneus ventricosus]|uniref:RNase H type-1 domain-containing protein n=1 Tax=Araneus ventricosus TaxID=182803 RepID=A0A4Y2BAR7_ARAVE|nr:hypothetical protein AVEN_158974-1 [Araneus ventricosus]
MGNEKADKAAKLATAPTNSSTPLTDFKKYTKLLLYTKWQRQWDTETENKLHAFKSHVLPWPSLMNRKADTLLTRLRTHTYQPTQLGRLVSAGLKQNKKTNSYDDLRMPQLWRHGPQRVKAAKTRD